MIAGACKYETYSYLSISLHLILVKLKQFFLPFHSSSSFLFFLYCTFPILCIGMVEMEQICRTPMLYYDDDDGDGDVGYGFMYTYGQCFWLSDVCLYYVDFMLV